VHYRPIKHLPSIRKIPDELWVVLIIKIMDTYIFTRSNSVKMMTITTIERCCNSMGNMITDGAITSSTALGQETGEIRVKTNNGDIKNYNK
jgi:hypothetical protein